MFIKAEDRRASLTFVAANPFECGEPIMKAVREDVDLGILPRNKLPDEPDLIGFLNRHLHLPRYFPPHYTEGKHSRIEQRLQGQSNKPAALFAISFPWFAAGT